MELSDTAKNLLVILVIVVLLVLNVFLRRRRGERTPFEVALSLLSEINRNQKLADEFEFQMKVKKFRTGSWKRNKNKLDFLDQSLHTTIDEAFDTAEGFNQNIDDAKKHRSTIYLSGINVANLKEPLTKSKQGLEEWLRANMDKQQSAGRRGCLFS
jgi:hypothetical protein